MTALPKDLSVGWIVPGAPQLFLLPAIRVDNVQGLLGVEGRGGCPRFGEGRKAVVSYGAWKAVGFGNSPGLEVPRLGPAESRSAWAPCLWETPGASVSCSVTGDNFYLSWRGRKSNAVQGGRMTGWAAHFAS